MSTKIVNTTLGEYVANLVVYRDWTGKRNAWRLFWANMEDPWCGIEESGNSFKTKREAVAYGERSHGMIAKAAIFHRP